MVTKIVLAIVSAVAVISMMCVVDLSTRLRFTQMMMDERFKKVFMEVYGKEDEAEEKK